MYQLEVEHPPKRSHRDSTSGKDKLAADSKDHLTSGSNKDKTTSGSSKDKHSGDSKDKPDDDGKGPKQQNPPAGDSSSGNARKIPTYTAS